jgi:hypothetical protein
MSVDDFGFDDANPVIGPPDTTPPTSTINEIDETPFHSGSLGRVLFARRLTVL